MANNLGLIDAWFWEHKTHPKQGRIFKICTYLNSARQGEEDIEAGFLISRCDVEIRQSCEINVRGVLLGMPAKSREVVCAHTIASSDDTRKK